QLIQQRLVGGTEPLEGGQFQDRLDLSFEQNRQHNNVYRRRRAQARGDPHVFRRHIRKQDLLSFQSTLPDKSLSQFQTLADVAWMLVGVTGQQLEVRCVGGTFVCIKDRVLGRDDGRQFRKDQPAHREHVLLPLQHPAKSRQVSFQPVLLGVLERRVLEI